MKALRVKVCCGVIVVAASMAPPAAYAQKTSMPRPGATAGPARPNELTAAERAAGWVLLFDGKSLAGWRGVGTDSVPAGHWKVIDGTITRVTDPQLAGETTTDLLSVGAYVDFELSWEWRISRAGNSGLKYNVSEDLSIQNAALYTALGFEYQLLDDSLADDNELPSHRSGSLFDIAAPNEKKHLLPPGEWNRSAVIVRGMHVEHWLNGDLILGFDFGSATLDSAIARSKFRAIRGFAEHRLGHLSLQDHGDAVSFRSIKIHPLSSRR